MSVPTTLVKPNLRGAGRRTFINLVLLNVGVGAVVSIIEGIFVHRRHAWFYELDAKHHDPMRKDEDYERAKRFKALRSFPGGVSGIKEYWSGAN